MFQTASVVFNNETETRLHMSSNKDQALKTHRVYVHVGTVGMCMWETCVRACEDRVYVNAGNLCTSMWGPMFF